MSAGWGPAWTVLAGKLEFQVLLNSLPLFWDSGLVKNGVSVFYELLALLIIRIVGFQNQLYSQGLVPNVELEHLLLSKDLQVCDIPFF